MRTTAYTHMTRTTRVRILNSLVFYMRVRPEHDRGLCMWMQDYFDARNVKLDVYEIIEGRMAGVGFEGRTYLDNRLGRSPVRDQFAQAWIKDLLMELDD